MQKDSRKNEERLLPFETIKAATEGDVDAMDKILKHYKPYIVKFLQDLHDGYQEILVEY